MKKCKLIISGILAVSLVLSNLISATAGGLSVTRSRRMNYNADKNDNALKASPDSLPEELIDASEKEELLKEVSLENDVVVEVNGISAGKLIFYMQRDSSTNEVSLPEPLILTVRQLSGKPIGNLSIELSPILNEDRERIRVEALGTTSLSLETPVDFSVEFVDKQIGDKGDRPSGGSDNFYLKIIAEKDSCTLAKLPIIYGADGFYTHYSAEYIKYYRGSIINGKYINIGEVNLNQPMIPSFVIEHQYIPMAGTEQAAIKEIRLNPDGFFTFDDGSTVMPVDLKEEGWIRIPIKMKSDSFLSLKREAVSNGQPINNYTQMTDLLIVYDDGYDGTDGYIAGGIMNPLPLVYHTAFKTSSSHSSGGSSSGGSGGSGGGSGSSGGSVSSGNSDSATGPGSSGTVVGPVQTARTTNAAQNDVGWKEINGLWYYINAENKPVTDWLYGADGKWYYLGQDGIRKTGWVLVDGKWYFLNIADGSMTTGIIMLNQQWYLFNPDGSMATGWAKDPAGNWHYFSENGIMLVDGMTPDGYVIGLDGIWRP